MRFDTPGDWNGRDVFQLCPPEFFVENQLIGTVMPSVNALGETSSAYLVPRKVERMHADGYPVCEQQREGDPPAVLLPDREALREWCSYAAEYRGEAYERAWAGDAGRRGSSSSGWSFLMGNKRRNLHCDYFCTYLDDIGVGVAFEPCAYDGKRYFTGYYTFGQPTVLQQWKNREGKKHVIIPRDDVAAIDQVVDLVYGWYDGGQDSVMTANAWHEGLR